MDVSLLYRCQHTPECEGEHTRLFFFIYYILLLFFLYSKLTNFYLVINNKIIFNYKKRNTIFFLNILKNNWKWIFSPVPLFSTVHQIIHMKKINSCFHWFKYNPIVFNPTKNRNECYLHVHKYHMATIRLFRKADIPFKHIFLKTNFTCSGWMFIKNRIEKDKLSNVSILKLNKIKNE